MRAVLYSKLSLHRMVKKLVIQKVKYFNRRKLHWSKQFKGQPVLLLSSFMHASLINEHKNTKLREKTCYESIY